jgi:integrase
MGRPPLEIGEHGSISYRVLGPKKVRALAKVRDSDGVIRQVTREGTSKQDARSKLQRAIVDRPGFGGSTITAESTIEATSQAWLAEVDRYVADGNTAPNTARIYRSALTTHVIPGVGALRLREATVPRLDAFIVGMRGFHGAGITKTSRTVLNGILGFAVRQGALKANPMRDVSRIYGARTAPPRALTPTERDAWLARMQEDVIAVRHDLPDLTRVMLATGVRIGECLALSFAEFDPDAKTLAIDYNIVRVTGEGLCRMRTKTRAGERTLALPPWAVDVLIARGDRLGWAGPVFPAISGRRKVNVQRRGGSWRDPSNTARNLREARDRAGYGWVTGHVFRKTVATVMDEAGLTAREIAYHLGHSKPSMTQDVYMGRSVASRGAPAALADMFGEPVEPSQSNPRRSGSVA